MGLKLLGVGGIDQKSNHLQRDPKNLVDARNIVADTNGEYAKRPGTEVDSSFSGDTYSDVIFIKSLNEYFFRNGSDYFSYKNGIKKTIPQTVVQSTNSPISQISGAEYLNTFIFTHVDGQRGTFKYDGSSIYFAGLPAPSFTVNSSGSSLSAFVLGYFDFMDSQGNQILGPSQIKAVSLDAYTSIDVGSLYNSGFYNGYIKINVSKTLTPISLAGRTLTYTTKSTDIVVGSKVPFRCSNTGPLSSFITELDGYTIVGLDSYLLLEVESISPTEIVFKESDFNGKSVSLTVSSDTNCIGSMVFRYFFSESEVTGYSSGLRMVMDPTVSPTQATSAGGINLTSLSLLSDIYDITTSKLRPPKCKYIYTYGYQIVCGGVISFFDFENKENLYTNNDLIMYSDLSTGDLGENFTESNRQLIGDTYDGQISGLGRVKDSLIVFKDKMVFSVDGVLIPGQFSLRKIETNEIGCTSFKSILSTEIGLCFQAQDGIYVIDGYSAKKITTPLDVFFGTIDSSLTRSVVNSKSDQLLFWTNMGFVIFDYEYNLWYIWDSIDASKGLTVDNGLSLRFFASSIARKFYNTDSKSTKNDSGVAINSYFRSAWFDLQEPSVLKKSTDIRIFSLKNAGQTIQLRYFLDWSESKVKGPFTVDLSDSSVKNIHRNLDIIQNQSFSFEFRNNVLNEDMNITGYDITTSIIQTKDKNVK